MSINYAILGILSTKPLTGYDVKKVIQDSSFMPWSGNNNQIYKALLELLDGGFVTNEVQHQDSAPSKKIYTITDKGLSDLKTWVLTSPDAPEFRKTFLIQFAWSDLLSEDERTTMLGKYEQEVRTQILMEEEKKRRKTYSPDRSPRESFLWEMIHDNMISSYENELIWIEKVRLGLQKLGS